MTAEQIINIVLGLVTLVLAFVGCSVYVRNIIIKAAAEGINSAEGLVKTGIEKMEKAIEFVYTKVPAFFKPFISKELIRGIVQKAFDEIELFCEKQLNQLDQKNENNQ
jgi:formate-dependent phosphoribosylglycinamide formyltransferase (GAR transformylase)